MPLERVGVRHRGPFGPFQLRFKFGKQAYCDVQGVIRRLSVLARFWRHSSRFDSVRQLTALLRHTGRSRHESKIFTDVTSGEAFPPISSGSEVAGVRSKQTADVAGSTSHVQRSDVLVFSIVIPTYQRRDVVVASVKALAAQDLAGSFEVVVVVDGSRDGTAAALRRLIVPFPFVVLEQPNRGAATARNAGAAAASGRILLFLDDDMEAHPRLLSEHVRSHNEGADVVFGHLPLHPESPNNFLSAGVKLWTDGRLERLSAPGAALTLHDLLTGQMSLRRELFNRMGGFDPTFTAGGTFGDEDIDFGYRLVQAGYRLAFNERAISWQKYVVQPRQYLRQWRQAGRADVAFARKHPEQAQTVFDLNGAAKLSNRLLWRPLASCQPLTAPLMNLLRWLALALVACWGSHARIVRFFFQISAMEYWRGVQEAGGMPRPRRVRVLS